MSVLDRRKEILYGIELVGEVRQSTSLPSARSIYWVLWWLNISDLFNVWRTASWDWECNILSYLFFHFEIGSERYHCIDFFNLWTLLQTKRDMCHNLWFLTLKYPNKPVRNVTCATTPTGGYVKFMAEQQATFGEYMSCTPTLHDNSSPIALA